MTLMSKLAVLRLNNSTPQRLHYLNAVYFERERELFWIMFKDFGRSWINPLT